MSTNNNHIDKFLALGFREEDMEPIFWDILPQSKPIDNVEYIYPDTKNKLVPCVYPDGNPIRYCTLIMIINFNTPNQDFKAVNYFPLLVGCENNIIIHKKTKWSSGNEGEIEITGTNYNNLRMYAPYFLSEFNDIEMNKKISVSIAGFAYNLEAAEKESKGNLSPLINEWSNWYSCSGQILDIRYTNFLNRKIAILKVDIQPDLMVYLYVDEVRNARYIRKGSFIKCSVLFTVIKRKSVIEVFSDQDNDNEWDEPEGMSFKDLFDNYLGEKIKYHSDYPSPDLCNEIVYENEIFEVRKILSWKECELGYDSELNKLYVSLPGHQASTFKCRCIYAYLDGKPAIDFEISYHRGFREGLQLVCDYNRGVGFWDKELNFVIPPKYEDGYSFNGGYAHVAIWDSLKQKKKWLIIDKQGKEYFFHRGDLEIDYTEICKQSEGMIRVSDLDLGGFFGFMSLAYHHDRSNNAGLWGFTDKIGKEIIEPQYIFAFDYKYGLALVCKGKWEHREDWEEERKITGYWSAEMLWGFIDKNGEEIIPCKYIDDDIYFYPNYPFIGLCDPDTQKYGIMGLDGKWIVEPRFANLNYDLCDVYDLFGFYEEYDYEDYNCERNKMGIYSLKKQKVLFEPQFTAVFFQSDGNIEVELFDTEKGKHINKIINRNGDIIHGGEYESYSSIFFSDYIVVNSRDDKGRLLTGLIDKKGNVMLPCKYELYWGINGRGIMIEQRRIIFKENDHYGLMTFDGKVLFTPKYSSIINYEKFYKVKTGGKDGLIDEGRFGIVSLDEDVIIPLQYKNISIDNDYVVCNAEDGAILYKIIYKT